MSEEEAQTDDLEVMRPCLDVYEVLKKKSGGEFQGPTGTIRKFEEVYRVLPRFSAELLRRYASIAEDFDRHPKSIDLLMVGGG